jgi:hypothetical protein
MPFVYSYRPEMGIRNSAPMRRYDELYQRTNDGHMIGWQVGMWFPMMAREEGISRFKAAALASEVDRWMAQFMMRNQGYSERYRDITSASGRDFVRTDITRALGRQRDAG